MDPIEILQQQSYEFWTAYKRKVASSYSYRDVPYQEVLARLEGLVLEFIRSVTTLSAEVQVASSDINCAFDSSTGVNRLQPRRLKTLNMSSKLQAPKIARLLKTACLVYPLVQSGTHCSKRQIYYKDTALYKTQTASDHSIDELSDFLQVPRSRLNILAKSKGLVVGNLSYVEEDVPVTLGTLVRKIPSDVDRLTDFAVSASFVLVVEKETVLHRLVEENFLSRMSAVVVTGCGYPDIATRLFLRRLVAEYSWLPILVLTDADPHGYQILSTYCFGSAKKAGECDRLSLPFLRWLGLSLVDARPQDCLPLTDKDVKKLDQLLLQPQLSLPEFSAWREELTLMQHRGLKCELDSLVNPGQEDLAAFVEFKVSRGSWT
jgi:meiotic recombination protein SPO11